jgi:hypothetical protein
MSFAFASAPDWFLAPDVLINAFSFLVLLAFFILCMRNYKINKNNGILYLGLGFALISVAQLAIVLTKFVIYYNTTFTTAIGNMIINYHIVRSTDTLYNLAFFFNRVLTLLGLYVIYRLPSKKKSLSDFILVSYFLILSAFVSDSMYYLFHATALILLIMLTYNYYSIYRKNHFSNTKILAIAFGILAISQLLPILSADSIINVVSNIIELVSYIILLVLIVRLKYGKKTKSDGYYLRHAQYHPRARRRN